MKTLVILTGPTGVGKTELSLRLARELGSPVFSCDSRQMYREMKIGTAAPTSQQMEEVPHYFVGNLSIQDYYSAARFEVDAIKLLHHYFDKGHERLLLCGGSMLYIDAICQGIDDMPDVDPILRKDLLEQYEREGLDNILAQLRLLDPDYYNEVDQKNPKRILHGLEICLMTGKPYSSFRRKEPKKRDFDIIKICLNREREDLYQRIDQRVLSMMEDGLEEEVRTLLPYRNLNALNTVGYQELFRYLDGECSLDEAIAKIQYNTHKYARKQLTWFRRDTAYHWFHPDEREAILRTALGNNSMTH